MLAVNGDDASSASFGDTVKTMKGSSSVLQLDIITDPKVHFVTLKRTFAAEGFGVDFSSENGWLVVNKVSAGSPADRAGVLKGDRIFDVNGKLNILLRLGVRAYLLLFSFFLSFFLSSVKSFLR